MFCFVVSLLSIIVALLAVMGGLGLAIWKGWERLGSYVRRHPESGKLLAEHMIAAMTASEAPPAAEKPEAKKGRTILV